MGYPLEGKDVALMTLQEFWEDVKDRVEDVIPEGWLEDIVKGADDTLEPILEEVGITSPLDKVRAAMVFAENWAGEANLEDAKIKLGPVSFNLKYVIALLVLAIDRAEETPSIDNVLVEAGRDATLLQKFIDGAKGLD